MNGGHHFFGRAASEKPQTTQVSWTQTGRLPVRFSLDWTSQAGGFSTSSDSSASVSLLGILWRCAISSGISRI